MAVIATHCSRSYPDIQTRSPMTCSHCYLPTRSDIQQREFNGETYQFCCYGCCLAFQVSHGQLEESAAAWLLIRIGAGAFLAMFIMLFSLLLYSGTLRPEDAQLTQIIHIVLWALATPVLIILGGPFIQGAWKAAWHGQMSADTLISIGTLAAYGYSAWQTITYGSDIYFDTATMILVLFTVGRYLEAAGRAQTARSLAPMLAARRAKATVVTNGQDCQQAVQTIRPEAVIRVHPGERLPVDGIVLEGHSQCNEAMLSGQHEPQIKQPDSKVYAGSINGTGQLLIRTTDTGDDTRWGQIGRFVSAALDRKSVAAEIIDCVAAVFVPMVILLALATMFYWHWGDLQQGLPAALAVLVVACPCALGLAAPLATAIGLGQAAQRGVLIRGGGVLENLAGIKAVAFDKTGTLTDGRMRLQHIFTAGVSEQTLLQRAAGLAQGSAHPLATGIAGASRARSIKPLQHHNIEAQPGAGLTGSHADHTTAIGSMALMTELGWPIPGELTASAMKTRGSTMVYVGWNGKVQGLLALEDKLLSGARPTIAALNNTGLTTSLLSGDTADATRRVAVATDIDTWQAELTPEGKAEVLQDWMRQKGAVAMVGDEMNDGPVLAVASVGIAVGGANDLTREAADVVLPENALELLPWVFQLARRVRRTIYINIIWALGYNTVALSLAASGLLLPIIAAGLMAGSSLLVVANSLRLNHADESPTGAQTVQTERMPSV